MKFVYFPLQTEKPTNPRTSPKIDRELMDKILHCLRSSQVPRKTIDIARSCGLRSSGEVNPTLYQLRRQGLVQKVQEQPPLWMGLPAMTVHPVRAPQFSAPRPSWDSQPPFSTYAGSWPGYQGGYAHEHFCKAPRGRGRSHGTHHFQPDNRKEALAEQSASSLEKVPPTAPQWEVAGGEDKLGDKVYQALGNRATTTREGPELMDTKEEGTSDIENTLFSINERISDLLSYNGDFFKLPISEGLDGESDDEEETEGGSAFLGMNPNLKVFDEEHWDGAGHTVEMPEDFRETLLKTLNQKPSSTAAAFVLAHDLDCSIANVNEVLSNCEKEGLVSRRGSMWVLNKTGREYMVSAGLNISTERVAPMQPPNSMSPRRLLGAPPAPPLQLLNTATGAIYTIRNPPKTNGTANGSPTPASPSGPSGPSGPAGPLGPPAPTSMPPPSSHASSLANSPVKTTVEPDSPSKTDTGRSTPVEGLPLPQTFGSFGSLNMLESNLAAMTAPFRPPPPSVELVSQRLANTGVSPTPASNAGSLWSGASSPEKMPPVAICGDDSTKNLPSLDINTESFAALNKNPVSALMEYAQSRHVEAKIEVISQKGPSHRPV